MKTTAQKLFDSAWIGDASELAAILEEFVDQPCPSLDSPLEAACYNAKPEAVEFLLRSGANPNTTSMPTGETLLHQVITKSTESSERTTIVKSLISYGADVNSLTVPHVATQCFMRDIRTRAESPLHRAAAYGDAEMVSALIEAGANKAAKDINGDSPLTWGSWHLRPSEVLVQLLYGDIPGWHGFPNPEQK